MAPGKGFEAPRTAGDRGNTGIDVLSRDPGSRVDFRGSQRMFFPLCLWAPAATEVSPCHRRVPLGSPGHPMQRLPLPHML